MRKKIFKILLPGLVTLTLIFSFFEFNLHSFFLQAQEAMKIEVPIEMVDYGLASSREATLFNRTKIFLDPNDYQADSTNYFFEIVAINTDEREGRVVLVDSKKQPVAEITVPPQTNQPARFRTKEPFSLSQDEYLIILEGTSAENQLQVYAARIIIQQTNPQVTRIQIPLTSGPDDSYSFKETAIDQVESGNYIQPQPQFYHLWSYRSLDWVSLAESNPFTLEAVLAGDISAALFDQNNQIVSGSEISVSSQTPLLMQKDFTDLVDATYQLKIRGREGLIYRAALYLRLTNPIALEIYYRYQRMRQSQTAEIRSYQRVLYDASQFPEHQIYHEATGQGQNLMAVIYDHSQNESGTTNGNNIESSAINFNSSEKILMRTSPFSLTSGNRFIYSVLGESGDLILTSASIVIKIGQPKIDQTHYRWRNDNGGELGGNFEVVTLLPNGNGDEITWTPYPNTPNHYTLVADESDNSYVYKTIQTDLAIFRFGLKESNGSVSSFSVTLTGDYAEYSYQWSVKPSNGQPWTPSAINDLQIGVAYNILEEIPIPGKGEIPEEKEELEESFHIADLSLPTGVVIDYVKVFVRAKRVCRVGPEWPPTYNCTAFTAKMWAEVKYYPGATYKADEDTPVTNQVKNKNVRLRFSLKNTGSAPAVNYQYRLQVAPKGTASSCLEVPPENYTDVPTAGNCGSAVACMADSSYLDDGQATTWQLSGPGEDWTWADGKIVERPSNQTSQFTLETKSFTEFEYNFQFTNNAIGGATYCFRLSNAGEGLDNYNQIAAITLLQTLPSFRLRVSTPLNYKQPYNHSEPAKNFNDSASNVLYWNGSSWLVQNQQPIYLIGFSDGSFEGNPYDEENQTDNQINSSSIKIGQQFTVPAGAATQKVIQTSFYLKKTGNPPDLLLTLEKVGGSSVTKTISANTVSNQYAWVEAPAFDEAFNLEANATYRLYLSCAGCSANNYYQVKRLKTMSGINSLTYDGGIDSGLIYTTTGTFGNPINNEDTLFRLKEFAGFPTTGNYISAQTSTGSTATTYSHLDWKQEIPSGEVCPTDPVRFQIGTANLVSGSCPASPNAYSYYGPNGIGGPMWWYEENGVRWKKRRSITINNPSGQELKNYQILLTINTAELISAGELQSDCDDLRFTSLSGASLNYWLESGCNTSQTKIWVKIPYLPATPTSNTTKIYLYYGNANASSASNGDATFIFFDDFNGTSLDTSKWTEQKGGTTSLSVNNGQITFHHPAVQGNYIWIYSNNKFSYPVWQEVRWISFDISDATPRFGQSTTTNLRTNGNYYNNYSADVGFNSAYRIVGDNSNSGWTVSSTSVSGQRPEIWSFAWPATGSQIFRKNYSLLLTGSDNINTIADYYLYLGIAERTANQTAVADWVRVRKYVSVEPTQGGWGEVETYSPEDYYAGDLNTYCQNVTGGQFCSREICPDRLAGFQYRKKINLTGAQGAGNGYQVKLKIGKTSAAIGEDFDLNGNVQDSFNDIRFTDDDGVTLLNYWIESVADSGGTKLATVWVKVNDNLDNNQSIYIYYGNANTSSASNGEGTFVHFQDWNNSNGWTLSKSSVSNSELFLDPDGFQPAASARRTELLGAGYALRSRLDWADEGGPWKEQGFGWGDFDHSYEYGNHQVRNGIWVRCFYGSPYPTQFITKKDGIETYTQVTSFRTGGYNTVELRWPSNTRAEFSLNDDAPVVHTTNIPTGSYYQHHWYQYFGTAIQKVDWTLIRKYVYPEPAIQSIDAQEIVYPHQNQPCLRYRFLLLNCQNNSPKVKEVKVNYTP
ncbi:MAG: DUF2341 domain-containing protein [Patescibacteria group bacterium]|nr:DUF2341 domain-containing protein [Patescibacteria group bacterium]